MNLGLSGKVALITGASRGIGEAIANTLASEGVHLALAARDAKSLAASSAGIGDRHQTDVLAIPADLSRLAEVERVVEETRARFGRIDILVNNAGSIRSGAFLQMPDHHWLEDWNLKPLGYVRLARTVFPLMVAQGGGRIINIAGLAARNPVHAYMSG